MSPEQVKGAPVDGRSDLFSLGVVLFELLTKQRPFAATTLHEVSRKIVDEPCPIPSTLAPELPPALNPILLQCLDKDPARRFQTKAQLAGVLIAVARTLAQRPTIGAAPAPAAAATTKADRKRGAGKAGKPFPAHRGQLPEAGMGV
jgi:serine/threonine-protein kinase